MIRELYKHSPQFIKDAYIQAFRIYQRLKTGNLPANLRSDENVLDKGIVKRYNRQRKYGPRKELCYAPFTSMFFSRAGYMAPCYATYGEKSDRWPETSIHDSWFHREFARIRDHIHKGKLYYACEFCIPIFESENFGSLLPNKYEPYGIGKKKYPAIMEFELSNRCNLECIMCEGNLSSSIRKNRDKKPPLPGHYNESFVKELEEFIPHLQMAEFTGGDPFLIPLYYDIWEMIHQMNPSCQILITTNANTMSPRIEKMLETHYNLHFNISIDSLVKEHYQQIRVNANYERVLENIKKFIAYCRQHNTSCNLLVCPMTINSQDFGGLIDFANAHDICVYFHTVIKPRDLSLKYQSPEYLDALLADMKKYHPPRKTKNQATNAQNYFSLMHLIGTWKDEKEKELINKKPDPKIHLQNLNKILSAEAYDKLTRILTEFSSDPYYNEILRKLTDIHPAELEKHILNESEESLKKQAKKMIE